MIIDCMSGLELLKSIVAGSSPHPPIATTMGFALTAAEVGSATFECETGHHLLNPFGTVHGAVALCLIDSAAGCALHTLLPAGVGYASIETKVNYVRPLTIKSGVVRAVGIVLSQGKKIATAEAKLYTSDGELAAHGSSTLLIMPNVKWRIADPDEPHPR